jgi:hypothetical protein
MRSINLYNVCLVLNEFKGNLDLINSFVKFYTQSGSFLKKVEVEVFNQFCRFIDINSINKDSLNGFHLSYIIPQISKEFDILRISKSKIINIELKSQITEKTIKQLKQNYYYLSIFNLPKRIFLFSMSNNNLYEFNEGNLYEIEKKKFYECLNDDNKPFVDDLNSEFRVTNFLVSPLNSTEKFLRRNYFLTDSQNKTKEDIINSFLGNSKFFAIDAKAGTGKTLLLYDIALDMIKMNKEVLIIHCAQLCEGHNILMDNVDGLKIISAKQSSYLNDLNSFDFVFVDEAHRYFRNQLDNLIRLSNKTNAKIIFCLDDEQRLGRSELFYKNSTLIRDLSKNNVYSLDGKIRINKEIASFIISLFDLSKSGNSYEFPNIDVLFAPDDDSAKSIIDQYVKNDYKYINLTPSIVGYSELDELNFGLTSHRAIGQEFNNVITYINRYFYYEENLLKNHVGPNPDHILTKLLFQNLTRVREKLCVVIIGNKQIFNTIINVIIKKQ